MKKQKHIIATICISTVVSGILLSSSKAQADEIVDYIAIFVPTACTMSGVVNTGEEHNTELQNGVYREDIGKTTLSVICNDNSGFSIYAVGNTNNEYGNTVLDSNSFNSSFNIVSGTATSGDVSNWSMKLSTDPEATYAVSLLNGFSNYSTVPSTYTKVATRDSVTGNNSQSASLNTTYAAYINRTQPADTYTGQVKYTLVHPANDTPPQPQNTEPGYIGYYPNTRIYEGSMGKQQISSTDTSATLLASNYSHPGYGFAGWNTAYDYSGEFYGPNETIDFETGQYTDGESGLSLYAVWVKSEGFIQNWTDCNALSPVLYDSNRGLLSAGLASVTALTDLRDNQTYAVARLADGKCWMIENLRLSSEPSRNDPDGLFSQGYGKSNVYGDFIGLANSENNNFTNTLTNNSLYGITSDSKINIGGFDGSISRIPRYNDNNTKYRNNSINKNYDSNFGYGNYYNWAATIASTKYYISGYAADGPESENSDSANTSICPAGWKLPRGFSPNSNSRDGDIALLDRTMGGTGGAESVNAVTGLSMSLYWREYPNNYVLPGNYNGSSVDGRGGLGLYWTSTASESDKARGLRISDSSIEPGANTYRKYYGFSVRCMIDD